MQSTSWEMLGWRKHKLESRLPGEISITSDMQMTPLLMAESEELKSLLMKVKEEGANAGLNLRSWHLVLSLHGKKQRWTQESLDESERGEWKSWLKTQHSKTKIMASAPIISWQIDGQQWKQWQALFSLAPKSLRMVTAAIKLKDACSLEEKLWQT